MEIIKSVLDNFEGNIVTKITLINDNGVQASCLTMGATWQEFLVPNKKGDLTNLLLSFAETKDYYSNPLCVCQSIGRVAGRINNGSCILNGKQITLPKNNNGNTLHGGPNGFNALNWDYTVSETKNSVSAIFQTKITEQTDGFPGDMLATIIYTLDNQDCVTITYSALADDKDTLFNPTNHVYFNLSDRQDLATHSLKINSSQYLDLADDLIPTGRVHSVEDSPYDFQKFSNVKQAAQAVGGFDDAFVVNEPGKANEPIAILRDNESGRQVTIDSCRNGLVMYSMAEIPSGIKFSRDNGKEAIGGEGLALEAQTLPDAINQENFGDIVLPKFSKKTYRISYKFDQI